jgi:glycosyltransferase involved in cell wall biosynthesis
MTVAVTTPQHPVSEAPADPLSGRDILCFSQDWGGDPLSKNHLMRLLARDNRVLWVNSIGYRAPSVSRADVSRAFRKLMAAARPVREAEPNLHVLNPLAIPVCDRPSARALNRTLLRAQVLRTMKRLGFRNPINWTFNPAAAVVAGTLGEETLIYHCVDECTEFSGVPALTLAEMEHQLLLKADLVITSADRLYQSKARVSPRTVLVRHGVDHRHFRRALDPATLIPAEVAGLPGPVIGFFGLVADWVNVELMAEVARRFSHGSLVVVGRVSTDVSALEALPNVHLLGRKPYEQLPAYCKAFDVALMPFRINELTLNANPLKVREYLAAGLPVVSTPIPEVSVLGQCRIAAGVEGFLEQVAEALADPGSREGRSESVQLESWEARLDEIRGHLAAAARGKARRAGDPRR